MTTTTDSIERRALTLAVICVEQRVEALRVEWRGMSKRQRALLPGLEQQIADEKQALAYLEQRRSEAYRADQRAARARS